MPVVNGKKMDSRTAAIQRLKTKGDTDALSLLDSLESKGYSVTISSNGIRLAFVLTETFDKLGINDDAFNVNRMKSICREYLGIAEYNSKTGEKNTVTAGTVKAFIKAYKADKKADKAEKLAAAIESTRPVKTYKVIDTDSILSELI